MKVQIAKVNGKEYANLGSGNLAEATGASLKAMYAGHTINRNGATLYYNGACDGSVNSRNDYQALVDRL